MDPATGKQLWRTKENQGPTGGALATAGGLVFQGAGSHGLGFKDLCLRAEINPDSMTDAWIAACTLQMGEILHTFDRDFKKILPAENLYFVSR